MTTNFRFDENKSFAENGEAFLDALVAQDPDMAAILRANWDRLLAIVRGGKRDHEARKEFNTKVISELDALVTPSVPREDG